MASARIRRDDLQSGAVPALCVKTGVPTDHRIRAGRRGAGSLPVTPGVAARIEAGRRAVYGLVALAIGVSILAVITRGFLAKGAAIAWAAAIAVDAIIRVVLWVGVRRVGEDVVLTRVHPDFARAAGRRYGRHG